MPFSFLLFVFLVGAEYLGLGNFIPIYKALPIALLSSFGLIFYLASKHSLMEVFDYKSGLYFVLFVMLTASAVMHGLIKNYAFIIFKTQLGYLFFMIMAFYIVNDRKKICIYASIFVLVHTLLVLINLNKLGHARLGSFNASYFMGDGNDFAWSVNIALPMAIYLIFTIKKFIPRIIIFGSLAILLLGIVGTQSRGATLALTAGFLYYFVFISKNKSSALVLLAVVSVGVVMMAPSNYFSRMETLGSYEQDTSAMGRIKAWRTATEMAVDNPVLGVGAGSFNSAYGRSYRNPSDPVRWISTHSVYFKVLAEYGFLGVFVYIMIIFHNLRINTHTARLIDQYKDRVSIDSLWPRCINWSIIACSVAAMFLSGIDYPHLFLLTGLTMGASRIVKIDLSSTDGDRTESSEKNAKAEWFENDPANLIWKDDK